MYPQQQVRINLQNFRKALGLTQSAVERQLNWRRGSLYDIEKGRVSLQLEDCWQLLQVYRKEWPELFTSSLESTERQEAHSY